MTPRESVTINPPAGPWPHPWPAVAELAAALPAGSWTLVGGLMTQLHAVHVGIGIVRPTNDVDIVLHIETQRGIPRTTADTLERLGYRFQGAFDPRNNTAHRFIRDDASTIDLVTSTPKDDQIDVLIADHAAPRVIEKLRGRDMVRIEGGTQALRRTINARVELTPGTATTISVPRPFAAVILKAAAYLTDTRDRDRHLFDAAALLACIEDPFAERTTMAGSDQSRLTTLADHLHEAHPAWRALPDGHHTQARSALDLLTGAHT